VHAITYSIVTRALILINVVVFVLDLQAQVDISGFIFANGLIPARFWASHPSNHWTEKRFDDLHQDSRKP